MSHAESCQNARGALARAKKKRAFASHAVPDDSSADTALKSSAIRALANIAVVALTDAESAWRASPNADAC